MSLPALSEPAPPLWPSDVRVLWEGPFSVEDFVPVQRGALHTNRGVNALARGVLAASALYVLYALFFEHDGLRSVSWVPVVAAFAAVAVVTILAQARALRVAKAFVPLHDDDDDDDDDSKAAAALVDTVEEEGTQQESGPAQSPPAPSWWTAPNQRLVPMDPFEQRQMQLRQARGLGQDAQGSPGYLTPAQSSLAATADNPYGNYRLYDEAPSHVYTGPVAMPPDDTIARMVDGTTFQNPGHIWYTRPDPSGIEHLHAPVSQALYGTHHSQAEEGWNAGGLWAGRR